MRSRPGESPAVAHVIGLARGLLGSDGRIVKMWAPGGLGDQPADLWEIVEDVSFAVREFQAPK